MMSRVVLVVLLAMTSTLLRAEIHLEQIGRVASPDNASEIGAFDPASKQLFVVNGTTTLRIWSLLDPSNPAPSPLGEINLSPYGGNANSVATKNGLVAVAVEAATRTDPGVVVFFDTAGVFLYQVQVGAVPDRRYR